jgi:hypothetical protein
MNSVFVVGERNRNNHFIILIAPLLSSTNLYFLDYGLGKPAFNSFHLFWRHVGTSLNAVNKRFQASLNNIILLTPVA